MADTTAWKNIYKTFKREFNVAAEPLRFFQ